MNKQFEGKKVKIRWRMPEHDWPYFTVLKVKPKKMRMKLRGEDYPDGSAYHCGDEFWVNDDEIVSMVVLKQNNEDWWKNYS